MTAKVKRIIDCIEWALIITLAVLCVYIYKNGQSRAEEEMANERNKTYMKIYDSQKLETLKKENRQLYSIIDSLKNAESAVEIRYKYVYRTDTVTKYETLGDSLYHYTYDNDTVKYDIDIMAHKLKWHKSTFELHDKFTIINSEKDGENKMIIKHSPETEIIGTDTWHKKRTLKDKFFFGPSVGFGYGVFNKEADVYVGFSIGYKF